MSMGASDLNLMFERKNGLTEFNNDPLTHNKSSLYLVLRPPVLTISNEHSQLLPSREASKTLPHRQFGCR